MASLYDFTNKLANFIHSPPVWFLAGPTLGGLVIKAFGQWEKVANKDDQVQIWMWLAGVQIAPKLEPWPQTFARLFDRVFGEKHLSWRCFGRSCVATLIACLVCVPILFVFCHPVYTPFPGEHYPFGPWTWTLQIALVAAAAALVLCLFDYVSLLETRFVLHLLERQSSWYRILSLLVLDVVLTGVTGGIPADLQLGFTIHPFQKVSQAFAEEEASDKQFEECLERDLAAAIAARARRPQIAQRLSELEIEGEALRAKEFKSGWDASDFQRATAIDRERDTLAREKSHFSSRSDEVDYIKGEIAAEEANRKNRFDQKRLLLTELSIWLPTFFTSIWLWLYAGSGFALKAARRMDVGYRWFSRRFDLENRPLQSIGLVAGGFVCLAWWTLTLASWINF